MSSSHANHKNPITKGLKFPQVFTMSVVCGIIGTMTKLYVEKSTKVSDVVAWEELYNSDKARVYEASNYRDYYRVKTSKTTKYFKGESAWMNVQRYVVDQGDFGGYGIFR